jgi:hypothetical protein
MLLVAEGHILFAKQLINASISFHVSSLMNKNSPFIAMIVVGS